MGSKTFDGVRFAVWSDDHPPPHVHAYYGEVVVIVELNEGRIRLARRKDRVTPASGKASDVRHVLRTAREFGDILVKLWEKTHG